MQSLSLITHLSYAMPWAQKPSRGAITWPLYHPFRMGHSHPANDPDAPFPGHAAMHMPSKYVAVYCRSYTVTWWTVGPRTSVALNFVERVGPRHTRQASTYRSRISRFTTISVSYVILPRVWCGIRFRWCLSPAHVPKARYCIH